MEYNVGKVIKFDGYIGEIVDKSEKYVFLDSDLNEKVKVGDMVMFRGEKLYDINRAFFVSKVNKDKLLDDNLNSNKLKKIDIKNKYNNKQ